jgi:hypothetical protein
MDNDLAILKQKVAVLSGMVESLLARPAERLPPVPQIALVNSAGQFMDWDGVTKAYVADESLPAINPFASGALWVFFRSQSQQWETLGSAPGIAVLTSPLYYGSSGGASATLYGGGPGNEKPGGTITVYEWMLMPGDIIASGVAIGVAIINGRWYLRNAACGPMPYPRGSG